jgi:putative hydrolase
VLPESALGVYLLCGCEVNVLDEAGALDLPAEILNRLDLVIASMHTPTFPPRDEAAHTRAWLAVAENPSVDIIGHAGDGRFAFDHERVIPAFKANGKVVEINAHSFKVRKGSHEKLPRHRAASEEIRGACGGVHGRPLRFVHRKGRGLAGGPPDVDFPEELVLNADARRFADWVSQKSGRTFEL